MHGAPPFGGAFRLTPRPHSVYPVDMTRILATLLMLIALPALAAQVYRWTDEHGQVVFGDEPPKGVAAEPVEIRPPQTFKALPVPKPATPEPASQPQKPKAVAYKTVEILRPAEDEAIRSNNGFLVISFRAEPDLAPEDRFEVVMDGKTVGTTRNQSLALENVDRGTHTVEVRIVDDQGNERAVSQPVTFHLLRHHI